MELQSLRANQAGVKLRMDNLSSVASNFQVDVTTLSNELNVYSVQGTLLATYAMQVDSTTHNAYYLTVLGDVFKNPGTYILEQVASNGTSQVYRTAVPPTITVTNVLGKLS